MNIIDWVKETFFSAPEIDVYDVEDKEFYPCPLREDHQNITFMYVEKYINSLNPALRYSVKEELKSGTIVTHEENVSLMEAKDYVRRIWISSSPPNITVAPVVW